MSTPRADVEHGASDAEREVLRRFLSGEVVPGHTDFEAALWGACTAMLMLRGQPDTELREVIRATLDAHRLAPMDEDSDWTCRCGSEIAIAGLGADIRALVRAHQADAVLAALRTRCDETRLPGEGHGAWSPEQWEEWSNEVAATMPEEWDGEEGQEDVIARFVSYASEHMRTCPRSDGAHCETCICGRRAPVQGDYGRGRKPPGSIAWWEHEKAWEGYGHSQSAEDIARRGGFGYAELVRFLGHEPTTWSVRGGARS